MSRCNDAVTTADRLAQLVDRSLVQSAPGARGAALPAPRDGARVRRRTKVDPDAATATGAAHCAYFAAEVESSAREYPAPTRNAARADAAAVARLAGGPRLSVSTEGARWAQLALRAVEIPGVENLPTYLSLLGSAAWAAVLIGDLDRARALALEGIDRAGDPTRHPRVCWIWTQATGGSFTDGADGCLAGAASRRRAG